MKDISFYGLINTGLRVYMELYEHLLHCKFIRYRFDHIFCDKSIDYTGLFLQPYRDVQDYVVYKSYSGYKIFLKTLDCDFKDIHKWVSYHPTINGESVNLPIKESNLCTTVLDDIRQDPTILSSESTYASLIANLSQCEYGTPSYYLNLGYLKLAAYKCFGIREVCRGYILAGEPGLGKTYDLLSSIRDGYWLPYDYKTKQYYDGYRGQSTMLIDDIGHYTGDEWKLVIRLVNDAPWCFPTAQVKSKDYLENVSRNLLLTTNNLDKLLSMDSNTRDAVCRRLEVYQYLPNGMVEHRIYNKHLGRYELVMVITREELRQRLSVMTVPTHIEIPKVRSNLIVPIIMGLNVITSYFKLPDISRLLIMGLKHVKLPCSGVVVDRFMLGNAILRSCLEFFNWSLCLTNRGRQLRYLKAVTGYGDIIDKIDFKSVNSYSDFIGQAEGFYQKKIGGFSLCGISVPEVDHDSVYQETSEIRTVLEPVYKSVELGCGDADPSILAQFGIDSSFASTELVVDFSHPGRLVEKPYLLYKKKSDCPAGFELFADVYTDYEAKIAPFRRELVTLKDESAYRPTNPYTVVVNKRAVNEFLHPKVCNKTEKRRNQRKVAKLKNQVS
jgi:hypothetical protein